LYEDEDAREEILALYADSLRQFCLHNPVTEASASAAILSRTLHYASAYREPCYDFNHPHHGVCQDPTRCVVPRHAQDGRWAGQRYVPPWLQAIAEKIDQHPTPSGDKRQWQTIVLSTGPTAAEDGQSNEDMVAAARLFSRSYGFRWDHLLTKTNPRRKRDNRIIKADQFLLEARIELVPAGTVSGTLAYRKNTHTKNKPIGVRSVCQPAPAPAWDIRWVFAYYGEPLDQDTESRLRARWLRHPRNRGRSGVSCSFESVQSHTQALHRMQLYRTACLELPGAARVRLARLRSDCGLKRVFRLGAGRGQLKTAKRLWKEALEITDQQMFASPVSQDNWAKAIVGARNWGQAMFRLAGRSKQASREWAFKYRWKQRREVVYPKLLHKELVAEHIPLAPRSFASEEEENMAVVTQQDNQNVRAQIEELARIVRTQHAEHMERFADIEAQIGALSCDLKAGRITRAQFDQRRKRLEEGLSKWATPASASVQ
jgi:hypothetical protein